MAHRTFQHNETQKKLQAALDLFFLCQRDLLLRRQGERAVLPSHRALPPGRARGQHRCGEGVLRRVSSRRSSIERKTKSSRERRRSLQGKKTLSFSSTHQNKKPKNDSALGCPEGRSSSTWVDFNLYGHQLVCHEVKGYDAASTSSAVDGDPVPVPHFGLALSVAEFHELASKVKEAGVRFELEPHLRFRGQPGEQWTMFFRDPSGNALEFKAMTKPVSSREREFFF